MTSTLEGVDLKTPPKVEETEEVKEEPKQEEPRDKTLLDYLTEYPDSPDQAQLELWKQQHGEVLCSAMSETEFFVFRTITREEFVNLQAHIAQAGQVSNFEVEKLIVDACTLWASTPAISSLEKKAGTFTTLHEQILQASNFMNPAAVGQFVIKL